MQQQTQFPVQIDCQTCRSRGSMLKTTVPRFSGIVRVIGVILVIPSLLGMFFSVIMLGITILGAMSSPSAHSDAEVTGKVIGFGIMGGFIVFIGICSLVSGLLGYLLLLNRKVFQCQRCGFVLDRA